MMPTQQPTQVYPEHRDRSDSSDSDDTDEEDEWLLTFAEVEDPDNTAAAVPPRRRRAGKAPVAPVNADAAADASQPGHGKEPHGQAPKRARTDIVWSLVESVQLPDDVQPILDRLGAWTKVQSYSLNDGSCAVVQYKCKLEYRYDCLVVCLRSISCIVMYIFPLRLGCPCKLRVTRHADGSTTIYSCGEHVHAAENDISL